MDLFEFCRSNLAWMTTVAVLWPLNIPMAALAYKIRQGHRPIAMESNEFWWRCVFASLILGFMTVGFIWLDYWMTDADFPAGPVHMVVLLGYIASACWLYFVFFALEDFFQALSMVLIYLYLPVIVLY